MAVLIAPNNRVLWRALPDKAGAIRKTPGKWHFIKHMSDDGSAVFICGETKSSYLDWEPSMVINVNFNDICALCWPYNGTNDNQQRLL